MKSPERYLNEYMRRTTPAQGHIKKWAHAATIASSALIVPSLCAIYYRQAGMKENEPYWVWASITMWKIHAGVVAVTIMLWLFEKPKVTRYLPVESLDDDEDER